MAAGRGGRIAAGCQQNVKCSNLRACLAAAIQLVAFLAQAVQHGALLRGVHPAALLLDVGLAVHSCGGRQAGGQVVRAPRRQHRAQRQMRICHPVPQGSCLSSGSC